MKKTAIVTGAAKNIGKGIVGKLVSEGWNCVLVDNDEGQLGRTFNEISGGDDGSRSYVGDVSSFDDVERLIDWLVAEGMSVDLLVNNAAYESHNSVLDLKKDELQKSFATNLSGPFYLTHLLTKQWINSGQTGGVVFISSVHGKVIRTHPLYSASKAAIEMFVKEAAVELGEHGIRVNAVAPGATQDTPELKEDFRAPLGYYEQPEDIAEMVSFLASDKSRFITGQTFVVDGGYSLTHTHHWLKNGRLE